MFLLVMSLSGSILVFHEEIDHAFFNNRIALSKPFDRVSIDRSFENVRGGNDGWEIRVPDLPQHSDSPLKYELRKENSRKWIFVHPETGELLNTVERADQRLVNVLLTLHYSFFAGTAGKIFVLFLGITFAIVLFTGAMLYRRSLLKVFAFKQHLSLKSKRAFSSSVHRLLGVWGLIFNILICVTGIRIAYVVASAGVKSATSAVSVPVISHSIDALLDKAATMYPEFQVRYLRFPSHDDGKLVLLGHLRSDPSYYGKFYSSISVNYKTGEIDGISLLKDKPFIDRILTILQLIHFGDYAGLWVKVIYTIGGLLPGILAVSGFFVWRYRRPKTALQYKSEVEKIKHY